MASDTYKLIDSRGTNIKFNEQDSQHVLTPTQIQLFAHALQCHQHCRDLESCVMKMTSLKQESSGRASYFPLIIGRRPSVSSSQNKIAKQPPEIKDYVQYALFLLQFFLQEALAN